MRNAVDELNSVIREIMRRIKNVVMVGFSLAEDVIDRELVAGISPPIVTVDANTQTPDSVSPLGNGTNFALAAGLRGS